MLPETQPGGIFSRLLLCLPAIIGWLAATPYIGIDHDATLYVVAAVRWLDPAAFARDPLFIDAQDRWSLFSPLLANALQTFGVGPGAMLMTLLAGALYVFATGLLVQAMLRGPARYLAFLLCASVPLAYAFGDVLLVSEGFVTARSFAVPISLLALAAAMRRRPLVAAALHLAALALHPIMALAPACLSALLAAGKHAGKLLLAGIAGIALLFVATRFELLGRIDGRWQEFLRPDGVVFILDWVRSEYSFLLAHLALLLLGARHGTRRRRPVYAYAGLLSLLGLGISLLAATTVFPAILLQAQLWRAVWLGLLLSVIAAADVGLRQIVRRHAPFRYSWALAAALVLSAGGLAGVVLAAFALLFCFAPPRRLLAIEAALRRYPRYAAVFFVGLLLLQLPGYLAELALRSGEFAGAGFFFAALDGFMRTGGFGLFALTIWFAVRRGYLKPVLVLLLGYGGFAVLHWDQRSIDRRDWETRYSVDGRAGHFSSLIHRGDVVFWQRSAERVWHELATAGYAGRRHVAGIVFSRERLGVLEPRMVRILGATLGEGQYSAALSAGGVVAYMDATTQNKTEARSAQVAYRTGVLSSYERLSPLTASGIFRLCADPDLDYVIDALRVDGAFVAEAEDRVGGRANKWYLYACARLRTGIADGGAAAGATGQ